MQRILPACAALALLASAPVLADDRGFYLGAGVGQANLQVDDFLGAGFDFDEDDTGWKLFAGYRFLPWLAIEGTYLDLGGPEISATQFNQAATLGVEVQALVAAAVFTLPVSERFEVYAKPGFAAWEATTRGTLRTGSVVESGEVDDDGGAFFLGAGLAFAFTENLVARLEYEYFEAAPEYDDEEEGFFQEVDAQATLLSLSLAYRF